MEVEITGSIVNVEESTPKNNPVTSVKVMHGTTDVTENYDVIRRSGNLTITKRPVTVTAEKKTFSYDGTEHEVGFTVSESGEGTGPAAK